MKQWNKPEMNIFSVRMNENIAASGDAGSGYSTVYIYYDEGGITRGGANYHCVGTNIQDTGINYSNGVVSIDYRSAISGCLA